jgi:hypothetical protein
LAFSAAAEAGNVSLLENVPNSRSTWFSLMKRSSCATVVSVSERLSLMTADRSPEQLALLVPRSPVGPER